MLLDDRVVEQSGTGDEAFSPVQGWPQAQQPDKVCRVGVEAEVLVGGIGPLVRAAPAQVPDVADQVALAVLRNQPAQMAAQPQ
jgi:hypothetical protein